MPVLFYRTMLQVPETNIADLLITIISIIFLFILKEVINVRYKDKMKAPVPAELILVIIATLISYFVTFNQRYEVQICFTCTSNKSIKMLCSKQVSFYTVSCSMCVDFKSVILR